MKRLLVFVHIGTEKTGSTSIQTWLGRNQQELSAEGIWALGEFVIKGTFNNLAIPLAAKADPGQDICIYRKGEFKDFRARVIDNMAQKVDYCIQNDFDKLVISSEHLSSRLLTIEDVSGLKDLFPDFCEFRVVVYLRPQDGLLLGAQAEGIKAGASDVSFGDPRNSQDPVPYGQSFYDYEKLLAPWESVFGAQNIAVRPYERSQLVDGNVVADFSRQLGFTNHTSNHTEFSPEEVNSRLPPDVLYFLAKLNPHITSDTRRYVISAASRMKDFRKGTLIPKSVLMNFFQSYDASNKKVALKFLQRDYLFHHKGSVDSEIKAPDFSPDWDRYFLLCASLLNTLLAEKSQKTS